MTFNFNNNDEAQDVLNIIKYGNEHVFLTGRAGTGKSTLLNIITAELQKSFIALAPTGNAALNIGGKTIHSFFQFDFAPVIPGSPVNFEYKEEKRALIRNLEVLIIDEVSMVRADIIDAIDNTLRYYRQDKKPFGGVQLLLVGDSFQLPPIISTWEWNILNNYYKSIFFFDAMVFKISKLLTVELIRAYRQQQGDFLNVLDAIRLNQFNSSHLSILNSRVETSGEGQGILTLATLKSVVEQINKRKLNEVQAVSHFYVATTSGKFELKHKPALDHLELRENAQVIFVKNDSRQRWVNGTIGTISRLESNLIIVRLQTGALVEVAKETWQSFDYEFDEVAKKISSKEIGRFTQYPLALCWAMTIHKSQGQTFDKIIVDLGAGSWDSGQTYVALSRCRSLEGLYLKRAIVPTDVQLAEELLEFSNGFNDEAVYYSSAKAKKSNELSLREEIEIFKEKCEYALIIDNIDKIMDLPINLIESFFLNALKAYCAFRSGQGKVAEFLVSQLDEYYPLKKSLGLMTYDSIFAVLHGAELLNNSESYHRGYQKIKIALTMGFPETMEIISTIAFDFDHIPLSYQT